MAHPASPGEPWLLLLFRVAATRSRRPSSRVGAACQTSTGRRLTESQFTTLVVIAFVLVVIGVTVGFTFFVRWFKRDRTYRPTGEEMLRRQAEIDTKFRLNHPDAEEESSGS